MPSALDTAVSQFELEKWSSASKCSSFSRRDYPYSSWPDSYKAEDRPKRDANIVASLHKHLLQSHPANASELLTKIQSQAESVSDKEIDTLIVSLLEKMIYIVDQCLPHARPFYVLLITTYTVRFVKNEPEKPNNWARASEKDQVKCYDKNCSACDSLRNFLLSPVEETYAFEASEKNWHCRFQVPSECNLSRNESQKPPVWTVTKTYKSWEKSHAEWEKRASKAQNSLRRLSEESMKQCLGDDYETLMNLDMIRLRAENSVAETGDESERSAKRVRLTD